MFEFNTEIAKQIVLISYGVLLGTLGNLLYRANNKLKISPIVIRVLYGAISLALYILFHVMWNKQEPRLNLIIMFVVMLIGYFVELLIEVLEEKVPLIIEKLIDKYVKPPERSGKNDK